MIYPFNNITCDIRYDINVYSSSLFEIVSIQRSVRDKVNEHKMLIRTYGAKTPFRARTRRRDDNIKMNLKEIACAFYG